MTLTDCPTLHALYRELTHLAEAPVGAPGEASVRPQCRDGRDALAVDWPGLGRFWLTGAQRAVVRELLDARLHCGSPDVDQAGLLAAAGLPDRGRLGELFRDSPAWGTLVVPGSRAGSYRLADLPGEGEAA